MNTDVLKEVKVHHNILGNGVIKDIKDESLLLVLFNGRSRIYKFRFPSAFSDGYLSPLDDNEIVYNCIREYRRIEEKEKDNSIRNEFNNFLDKKQINYLYHYTDINNLNNIITSGCLKSRALMDEETFVDGANDEIINHTPLEIKKYVRFFYKPDTPTLYRSEGIRTQNEIEKYGGHRPIPVALLYDRNIVFHEGVKFLDGSGSSRHTNCAVTYEDVMKFKWESILNRGSYWLDPNYLGESSRNIIKNYRNAEFLYPNQIETEYIRKIAFRTKLDLDAYCLEYGYDDRFIVDDNLFSNSNNYVKDFKVIRDNCLKISICFNKSNYFDYKLKMELSLLSGKTESLNIETVYSDGENCWLHIICNSYKVQDISNIRFYMDGIRCFVWENNNAHI